MVQQMQALNQQLEETGCLESTTVNGENDRDLAMRALVQNDRKCWAKWLDSSKAQDGQERPNTKFGAIGCIKWLGAGASAKVVWWELDGRLVGMRKVIDEPMHVETCDCFTMNGFGHGEGSRRGVLVSSSKYQVGNFKETVVQDGAKEKWFRS